MSAKQFLVFLSIWMLEIFGEAVGTCLILLVSAVAQFAHMQPPLHNDLTFAKAFGIALAVLIEFALTGYLVTTLIARIALQGQRQRIYPYASAALYFLHSTIFFVVLGNSILRSYDLVISSFGACITFVCAWTGNRMIRRWVGQ